MPARLQRFLPPLGDAVLAVVMATYALYEVVGARPWFGPVEVNAPVVTAMALSLAWRRRFPLAVLVSVGGSIVGLGVAYGSSQAWASLFPFLVAVYSAAAYSTRPWVVCAVVAAAVVGRELNDPFVETLADALFTSTISVLGVLAGLEGRRLAVRSNRLDDRAEALEREEEELAAAAAAGERRRIARELHDIISHGLGVMVLQAGAVQQIVESDPAAAKESLGVIRATGLDAINELGALLSLVREDADSSREPQPALADLPSLVERARNAALDVSLDVDLDGARLSQVLELSAFRVVQEALTNAAKYAPEAHVDVNVRVRDSRLEVSVVDDGVAAPDRPHGGRRGLAGMAERVSIFGGHLRAGPRRGGGWEVEASFPCGDD